MSYEKMKSAEWAKVVMILTTNRIIPTGMDPSDRALAEYIQGSPLDSEECREARAEVVRTLQAAYNGKSVAYFGNRATIRFIRPRNRADVARDLRARRLKDDIDRFEAHLKFTDGTKKGGYPLSKLKLL